MIWSIFLWYCGISIALGLFLACGVARAQWRRRTKRVTYYSPDKSALGYLISAIIGCPVINLVAAVLILFARIEEEYRFRSWSK